VQADRQSAVIVDAASPAKANMQWIKPDSLRADTVKKSVGATRFNDLPSAMHCRQSCSERPGVNAIPVRDYERVVDDVKCIRATIDRFEGGRWRKPRGSGGEAPTRPAGAATPANHSTEIYWFARSAAAVAMYFESK
jgi:hypothetical protein